MEQTKLLSGQENEYRVICEQEKKNKEDLNKKSRKKRRCFWAAGICSLAAVGAVTGVLVLRKEIRINPMVAGGYEVHGVDVSHYQGTIDWDVLSQNQDFAFIKATEGSTHSHDALNIHPGGVPHQAHDGVVLPHGHVGLQAHIVQPADEYVHLLGLGLLFQNNNHGQNTPFP